MAAPVKHTRYRIDASYADDATPKLKLLKRVLDDLAPLHAKLAAVTKARTRKWIRTAAQSRHTTAAALGATPTNYLNKRAADMDDEHDAKGARLIIRGAIFARVAGDVTVTPKRAKMLTIPVNKDSYGKRARDFDNLIFKVSKKSKKTFLMQKKGKRLVPMFMLVKSVVLPQDAGLLPGEEEYAAWSEEVAGEYLDEVLA